MAGHLMKKDLLSTMDDERTVPDGSGARLPVVFSLKNENNYEIINK